MLWKFVPGKWPLRKSTFLNKSIKYLMSDLDFMLFLVLMKRKWQTAFAKCIKLPGVCDNHVICISVEKLKLKYEMVISYILIIHPWQIVFNESLNSWIKCILCLIWTSSCVHGNGRWFVKFPDLCKVDLCDELHISSCGENFSICNWNI